MSKDKDDKNIFERIIDTLNKPIVGGKKDDGKEAKKSDTNVAQAAEAETDEKTAEQAEDLQAKMLERQRELNRQMAQANAEQKRELAEAKLELTRLRHEYEKEIAKAAETHAKTEDWTYTVVPGDSMWAISERFYNDGTRWMEIYEANKELIGDNPRLIHPGYTLVIPNADED